MIQIIKLVTLILFICLVLVSSNIFSTEETNPHPFFYINQNNIQIQIKNKNVKLCTIFSKSFLNYNEFKVKNCNELQPNLSTILDPVIESNDKKEIILLFVDENNKLYSPIVRFKKREMKLISIIYNLKDKSTYMELNNFKNNYLFLGFNYKKAFLVYE